MKKPDRGPHYRQQIGGVELREIKRRDLVKDPYRVRGRYADDGRTRTFDAMNWREARDRAAAINKQIEEGRIARAGIMKFGRVWKEWRQLREEDRKTGDLRSGTLRRDKVKSAHVLREYRSKDIDKIMSIDVERWAKRLSHEYSLSWGRACSQQVRQVLDYAVRKRYLVFNPLRQDPIKLRKTPDERPWVPAWDLMERAVTYANQPARPKGWSRVSASNMRVALALGAGASLRSGEVRALKWSQVDFADRIIKVREGVLEIDEDDFAIGPPKTPASIRDVPMCQWVYEALLDHAHVLQTCAAQPRHRYLPKAAANPLGGLVVRNRSGFDVPISQPNWSMSFKRFLVRAGLRYEDDESEWHWHVLRRFYISARLALGDDLMAVGEAVGHRDPSITAKIYARALPEAPPIWRHRFGPADPTARIIDGVAVACTVLQAPEEVAPQHPEWVREAVRLLQGGWRVGQVVAHVRKGRSTIAQRFRDLGLAPPQRMYIEARDRRYEQLTSEGHNAIDIATMTGTSVDSYGHWLRTHEAGVPNTGKSLITLRKSERRRRSVATDAQQKQLSLL